MRLKQQHALLVHDGSGSFEKPTEDKASPFFLKRGRYGHQPKLWNWFKI